jgi:hypothetical protein
MNWFKHFWRFSERTNPARRSFSRPPVRLGLEALEDRLAPASVFVVAPSVPADSTHFHSLSDAASAANVNGTVTIEPGALGTAGTIDITERSLTIQGDPNVPGSILAEYSILVDASGVTLTNLRLASVTIVASTQNTTISKSLVGSIVEMQSNIVGSQSNVITQNYITGTVRLSGNIGGPAGDLVTNNTFANGDSSSEILLLVDDSSSTMVSANRFIGGPANLIAIDAFDTGSPTAPTTISNNSISVAGLPYAGIEIEQSISGRTAVAFLNNTVNTNGQAGVRLNILNPANFEAVGAGNDLQNNMVGVLINGATTSTNYNIDLGGGALGSLGGNNFRSFTSTGTIGAGAIELVSTAAGVTIPAQHNIFQASVTPNNVIDDSMHGAMTGTGTIDVSQALDANHAFVQTLYNEVLGRTGTPTELDAWVQALQTQGQAAVAHAMLHSSEALGRVVDSLYLRFLSRASAAGERAAWTHFLQNGGSEEAAESVFLTSPEYLSHVNVDFVQSLYLNILGRVGSATEVEQWNNAIPNVGGIRGVADFFIHSTEYRLNTLRSDFRMFLHRTPSDAELTPLVNSPQDLLTLEGTVLSSPEFFTNG